MMLSKTMITIMLLTMMIMIMSLLRTTIMLPCNFIDNNNCYQGDILNHVKMQRISPPTPLPYEVPPWGQETTAQGVLQKFDGCRNFFSHERSFRAFLEPFQVKFLRL